MTEREIIFEKINAKSYLTLYEILLKLIDAVNALRAIKGHGPLVLQEQQPAPPAPVLHMVAAPIGGKPGEN